MGPFHGVNEGPPLKSIRVCLGVPDVGGVLGFGCPPPSPAWTGYNGWNRWGLMLFVTPHYYYPFLSQQITPWQQKIRTNISACFKQYAQLTQEPLSHDRFMET